MFSYTAYTDQSNSSTLDWIDDFFLIGVRTVAIKLEAYNSLEYHFMLLLKSCALENY